MKKQVSENSELQKEVVSSKEKAASKPVKPKKISKSKEKKPDEPKHQPQYNKKIQKILSDMFHTKSAKFIRLHQAGLKTSEIAKATSSHPSFVHGVLERFKRKQSKS